MKRKVIGPVPTVLFSVAFAFFLGISFSVMITQKLQCGILPWSGSSSGATNCSFGEVCTLFRTWAAPLGRNNASNAITSGIIVVARTNPAAGAVRRLPPGIVVSESDLHLRRLWGSPAEDSATRKYLLALAVGYEERANVNAIVHKFSDNFDIVLFHYDDRTTEWDELEWSREVAHVSVRKQTKWWFTKRFLQPSTVAPYDYIFLWDEDRRREFHSGGVIGHGCRYLDIVRKHRLEISQPGLDATKGAPMYDVTARKNGSEMHKCRRKACWDVHKPPCSRFGEVMAPVFSRDAWRCVWHMIQNDLVHGWPIDSHLWRCVDMPRCYVVFRGRVPGVYEHWDDCSKQVDGFRGNSYKSYNNRAVAEARWFIYLEEQKNKRMKTLVVVAAAVSVIMIAVL